MAITDLTEVWLRGAQSEYPVILQPIVFALQQSKVDILKYTADFDQDNLYKKPGGAASVSFHLRHITGVLDRMFTYASFRQLNADQRNYLINEGEYFPNQSLQDLVDQVCIAIDHFLILLKSIDKNSMEEPRNVGRQHLPSTVFGLLFHAAEHTQRHVGQLLVTIKVLNKLHDIEL